MADEDACDLAEILAPLTKDQLEVLIAKLVGKHNDVGQDVVDLAAAPVDVEVLAEDVAAACANEGSVRIGALMAIMDRAVAYATAQDPANALVVAEKATERLIATLGLEEEEGGEVEEEDADAVLGEMEVKWSSVVDSLEGEGQLGKAEKLLGGWKEALTAQFGPIFSDQLRAIARKKGGAGGAGTKRPAGEGKADAGGKKSKKK